MDSQEKMTKIIIHVHTGGSIRVRDSRKFWQLRLIPKMKGGGMWFGTSKGSKTIHMEMEKANVS